MNEQSTLRKNNNHKTNGKYPKLVEALKHYHIIHAKSQETVTVKFNNGGIIYIEVEDKRTFK